LLACNERSVDLDAPLIETSSEPNVLAVVRERIENLAVDEQRSYWFGSHLPRSERPERVVFT